MAHLSHNPEMLAQFCEKWHVDRLEVFGSAVRADFHAGSDIDLLVDFKPDAPVSLWDWAEMVGELRGIFGRKVDLVERAAIRNPLRLGYITANTQVIYAA